MDVVAGEHLPHRPTWDCVACERPWPCDAARERLTTEFRRMPLSLTTYMAGQYSRALNDLVMPPAREVPPDLHERFLSWTRQAL